MTPWIKDGNRAAESFLERILRCFHRSQRPMFLGELAVDIVLPLSQTQELVDILVERAQVRAAKVHELAAVDAVSDAAVYVLVNKPEPKLAHLK